MLQYISLGIIQGLTEFLPISSSGHLLILQRVFAMRGNEVEVSLVLHAGTVLALIMFFIKDIKKLLRDIKSLSLIAIVTIITGIIGIIGKDFFESLFVSCQCVSFTLMITGLILLLTKKFMDGKRDKVKSSDALILGFTQGIAIIPGISRSGITISTLLFRRIDRQTCFKFSFLASIPAVMGAIFLEAKEIGFAFRLNSLNFSIGFIFSFLSGIFSLWILKRVILKAKLHYFGYYCIFIAIITMIFLK